MEQQIEELRAKMEKSGQALSQFEKELGVINPEEKTNILSARLLQLNTEYTNAQGDRVRKEAIWNSVKTGSLESVQVSGQAEQLVQLNQKLNEARQRFSEIKTTYGATHPEYRKAASQVAELTRQFDDMRNNIAQRVEVDYSQSLGRERMLQKAVQGNQGRIRPHQRPVIRIPATEARSRSRQEAVRRAGPQDQGSGHQRRIPEQQHPHRRHRPPRSEASVPELSS